VTEMHALIDISNQMLDDSAVFAGHGVMSRA
jgi:hypothetical protein